MSVQFSEVFVNVWTAQFESDSRVPLVDFRDGVGVRASIFYRFFIILGARGRPGTLPDPVWHPRPKKSENKCNLSPKWRPFWDLCPPFGHLGAHLEAPGGKKSVPKAPEGDFVDIVQTSIFHRFLLVFGASGHPVRQEFGSPTGLVNQEFGSPGALWADFLAFVLRLNFGVPKVRKWSEGLRHGRARRRGGRLRSPSYAKDF